jgi:hypothetical protein
MSSVIVTERSQLKELIETVVREVSKETVPEIVKKATQKPWMTKEELMELSGWSSRTLQNLRSTNQLPHSKHGRKILYPRAGVMEFLEDHEIPARD